MLLGLPHYLPCNSNLMCLWMASGGVCIASNGYVLPSCSCAPLQCLIGYILPKFKVDSTQGRNQISPHTLYTTTNPYAPSSRRWLPDQWRGGAGGRPTRHLRRRRRPPRAGQRARRRRGRDASDARRLLGHLGGQRAGRRRGREAALEEEAEPPGENGSLIMCSSVHLDFYFDVVRRGVRVRLCS